MFQQGHWIVSIKIVIMRMNWLCVFGGGVGDLGGGLSMDVDLLNIRSKVILSVHCIPSRFSSVYIGPNSRMRLTHWGRDKMAAIS